jgi:hypothetical protein
MTSIFMLYSTQDYVWLTVNRAEGNRSTRLDHATDASFVKPANMTNVAYE